MRLRAPRVRPRLTREACAKLAREVRNMEPGETILLALDRIESPDGSAHVVARVVRPAPEAWPEFPEPVAGDDMRDVYRRQHEHVREVCEVAKRRVEALEARVAEALEARRR